MADQVAHLRKKIEGNRAKVAVIGLGYVGLPLAIRFTEERFPVVGLDIDEDKVAMLKAGESYIAHIPATTIGAALAADLQVTTDMAAIETADAIILCLPTPLGQHREPDLSFVLRTLDAIIPHLRPGQLISLESTTYPGTTDEELKPRIEANGLVVGEDIFLVYSPEREDPANPDFSTRTIPKICGGITPHCAELGRLLYESIVDQVVPVSSTRAGEMTKLLENIHRAVNIGLVNEMKIIADRMGIDLFEVIEAAATKPFGFVPYYPGPGLGGHCIPIDPFYLTWKAREFGLHTRFIELAGEINSSMPEYVLSKIADGLNEQGKPIRGSRILVLGIAYKKNVDDMRESPSVAIMELLRDKGGEVAYSDPHVPRFPKLRAHQFELSSVPLSADTLADYDAVLLATNHDGFDYELIRNNARLIIDTRGVYRDAAPHIFKA